MAAGTFTFFTRNFNVIDPNDLLTATVKFALVTSAYTPNTDETTGHHVWADASANEIATGNGYTAKGQQVTNDVLTSIVQGFKYSSDNVSWTASGGSIPAWRFAVLLVDGTLWSKTDPMIGYFLGDNTPADVPATADGNTLQLTVPTNGWFDIS